MVFKIDGVSYNSFIVGGSYNIIEENDYGSTEYQDGWWNKHRTIVRTRVNGTVRLAMKPSDYTAFYNTLKAAETQDCLHHVELYVNTSNSNKIIQAFITIKTTVAITTRVFGQQAAYFNVDVTIEER